MRPLLLYALLAGAVMIKLFFGHTYYSGEILYSHPLWYDWLPRRINYDLIDSVGLYYPHDWLYNRLLHEGKLLLWNPFNFCGHSVYGDGKSALLYPPKLVLHALLPVTWAHDIYLYVHLVGMGYFFHRWLSALGLRDLACRFGSAVWMLNGFVQTWLQSEYSVTFGCWLPLIFERLWSAFGGERVRWEPVWHATLLLAMLGYCGHVQFVAHCLLLCAAWTGHLVVRNRSRARLWLALVPMLVPPLLMLPQLWPVLQFAARAERSAIPVSYQVSSFQRMLLSAPLTAISPDFWGSLPHGFAWKHISKLGDWVQLETCSYVGILGLLCVFYSYGQRHRSGWRGIAALWLLLLLVPATPVYHVVCMLIPPLQKTMATRWLFMLMFLTCTHVGYGAQTLGERAGLAGARRVCGALLLAWLGWLLFLSTRAPEFWTGLARQAVETGVVRFPFRETFGTAAEFLAAATAALQAFYSPAGLPMLLPLLALLSATVLVWWWSPGRLQVCLGLLCLDLLLFSWDFNTTVVRSALFPPPPVTRSCSDAHPGPRVVTLGVVRPNTGLPLGLTDVGGQDSLYPSSTEQFFSCWETGDPSARRFADRVFPLSVLPAGFLETANVGWVLAYPNTELPGADFEAVAQQPNGIRLWRKRRQTPAAYVAGQVEPAADLATDLSRLRAGAARPLVEAAMPSPGRGSAATVVRRQPGEWLLQASGPGWLVLSEAGDPGWRATVDGAAVRIHRAQGIFQAVRLSPGPHRVEFRYFPPGLLAGLAGGSVGLLLLLVLHLRMRKGEGFVVR